LGVLFKVAKPEIAPAWPADAVERRSVGDLVPYARNARTHSEAQVAQIAASIREWGWTIPVLIDEDGMLIAGHGRVMAARTLGITEVPVMVARGWTEAQKRAYILADNKLALNAGWDVEMLRVELTDLRDMGADLELVGFDDDELGVILSEATEGLTDPDETPEPPVNPVAVLGDVWIMGKHRIVCGSSTDADTVAKVLNGVSPHLMVTDPPYGVEYDATWRGKAGHASMGKIRTGVVLADDRPDWREAWALFPGNIAYVWHGGLHSAVVAESLTASGFTLRAQIIWNKSVMAISRGDYHWKHEPCWYAVKGTGHWAGDRKQTTVWDLKSPIHIMSGSKEEKSAHPTQKPVECMKRPIENNSSPGQAVYEPFSGSGTTIIACEMTGRACHAIELNPAYVDVAVKRWQDFTGQAATLEATGQSFADVCEQRYAGAGWAANCAGSYDDAVASARASLEAAE
jgi:DNA modification methylase